MNASFYILCLCGVFWASIDAFEIHSPCRTNYGDWRGWRNCPAGLYAAAIKIKAEGDQRGRDDTGLNAVALFCLPLDWNSPNTDNEILSGEGAYGGWQAVKFCPRGQVIIGFQLRSETDQRGRDDVAADNFLAYCGSPFRPVRDLHNYIQGDTEGWGDWTAEQWCPDGFAVCGINSQIEGPQGGGDDTSLNNVDLKCCEVPKVSSSCKPDYKLVNVDWFDNSRGQRGMVHEYTERTSITRTTGTTTTIENSERKAVAEKISTELGMGGSELAFKVAQELSMSHERSTTESLQTMVQNTVQHETEKKIVITVPAGKRGTLKQLHFTCGDYDIAVALTINRTY